MPEQIQTVVATEIGNDCRDDNANIKLREISVNHASFAKKETQQPTIDIFWKSSVDEIMGEVELAPMQNLKFDF